MSKKNVNVKAEAIEEAISTYESFLSRVRTFDESLQHELARLGQSFQHEAYEDFCESFQRLRSTTLHDLDNEGPAMVASMQKSAEAIRKIESINPNKM